MELEELVLQNKLFEVYKPLLSSEQQDVLDLFLTKGLQIVEIAELKVSSRQAVQKNIKLGLNNLLNFEKNLQFVSFKGKLLKALENVEKLLKEDKLELAEKKISALRKEV